MKNTITFFLAGTTLILSCVCAWQWQKLKQQQGQIISERAEAEASSNQIAALESVQRQLEEQRNQLRAETEELSGKLVAKQTAETVGPAAVQTNGRSVTTALAPGLESGKSDAGGGEFGKMVSKMMQDPNMKKFIADQQRVMADQLYSPLIRQLGLTPDEAAKFKDLITEPMAKAAEQATSLFDSSSTNRSAVLNSMSEQQKNTDEQLKALLGDARYAQYKDYQQTSGERMQLNVFKQQNAGSDNPITDAQTEQLLGFMKEEKANLAANGQSVFNSQDPGNLKKLEAMMSDEQADKFMQTQDTLNQKVLDRARTILSPDQLDAFGKFQSSQSSMMRMGMNMARKMFAPDKAVPVDTAPNQ